MHPDARQQNPGDPRRDDGTVEPGAGAGGQGGPPGPAGAGGPRGQPGGPPAISGWRIWLFLVLAIVVMLWSYRGMEGGGGPERRLAYSEFRQEVRAGRVRSVHIDGQRISGTMAPADTAAAAAGGDAGTGDKATGDQATGDQATGEAATGDQATGDQAIGDQASATVEFATVMPPFGDTQLLPLLEEHGVTVEAEVVEQGGGWLLFLNALPLLLLLGLGFLLITRMRSQGQRIFSIGQNKAQRYEKTEERTTFDDVAGIEGAKAELQEIIDFLRDPDRFRRLGGTPPRGILLVGPPGSGKTLLARATAGEAEVPFYSITGSDFMEMFVGVGASRVRSLFADARKSAPSIVFIDELDSIGRRRGAGLGGGHDEREQTLNQLLSAMDGFEPQEGVIVMAATNRPDILDPALLRPGRFDRRVVVEQGGVQARLEILRIHARNKPLADDIDLEKVARGTPGFSGADLENLLNEAALIAARGDKDAIAHADLEEARDKILLGLKREGVDLDEDQWRLIAYHEAGHAVVAAALPGADQVQKVTIVPRGRAMGVTHQLPERDRYLHRREDLADRLTVLMGGRGAEQLVFDTATSGAENDLKTAAELARKMVTDWGMGEGLENLAVGGERGHVFLGEELAEQRHHGEETARRIDRAVQGIVTTAAERARSILAEHRAALDQVAEQLIAHEEISGRGVDELVHAGGGHQAREGVS